MAGDNVALPFASPLVSAAAFKFWFGHGLDGLQELIYHCLPEQSIEDKLTPWMTNANTRYSFVLNLKSGTTVQC